MTLLALARERALQQPELQGFTMLEDGEQEERTLTYAELDRRARAIAATLQAQGAAGERVVLLYPPGLDYVMAFFGCLYAGSTAVPAYPPDPSRLGRTLPRLLDLVADAKARFVLTTEMIASMSEGIFEMAPELRQTHWVATDALPAGSEQDWREPDISAETLAFIQYTSGSTGTPKGVCLSHGNLLHNSRLIQHGFGLGADSVGVIWLPPYHDMGLIGGILQPLFCGFPVVLMSPLSFLQKPMRWLNAVSRYRATVSGGPNFAFELCVRKSTPEERARLDLSSWEVAFCGAEPIRAQTLERFQQAFGPSGFKRQTIYPCYGLAEATLIVTGGQKQQAPLVRAFDKNALTQGEARTAEGGSLLVGCGGSLLDQEVAVVDPASFQRCQPGRVGEIWVRGPSVARGYWQMPEASERTFGARLANEPGAAFLRTGDLGFLQGSELFVTGRLKDLIIIRGRNLYPHDIEATTERSHPAMRSGCTAAFSVDEGGEERLVVVQEVDKAYQPPEGDLERELERAVQSARSAIAEAHEVSAWRIVLVPHNSIPKTSSGKLQRSACRAALLEGSLPVLHEQKEPSAAREPAPPPVAEPAPAARALPSEFELAAWLQTAVARALGVEPRQVDARKSLSSFGLDSLRAVELQVEIQEHFGVAVPLSALLRGPTLMELAYEVQSAPPIPVRPALPSASTDEGPQQVSDGQRALWFLYRLAPQSSAYNISRAVRIRAEVDVAALHRALQTLVDRHPALRTTFEEQNGQPVQRVRARAPVHFEHVEASGLDEEALRTRLADEAHRPFSLEQGPLLRAALYTRSPREHALILSVHHAITDFWSLGLIAQELGAAYSAEHQGRPAQLPPPALSAADYTQRQAQALAGPRGEQSWRVWRERLAGELPVLELPTDRRRPPMQSFRGAVHTFHLDAKLTRALRELGRARGTTLFTTLLSTYAALLHRLTGQSGLIIGTPTAGRGHPGSSRVIGYLVNLVPVRMEFSGKPSFTQLLEQTRARVQEALEHSDFPLLRMVERLARERDPSRSPLFQTAFALQQPQRGIDPGLAALAVDQEGIRVRLGEQLEVESLPVAQRFSQFELSLTLAEVGDGLGASLEYCTDLFEPETVARLAERFTVLLEGLVARPELPLSEQPLLGAQERELVLERWNQARLEPAGELCAHQLLEQQARSTPEAIALVQGSRRLTYAQLERRANGLAHRLRSLGVGPDDRVGLYFERSLEAVIAVFGVLKAGAAFLLLDTAQPRERLAAMLQGADTRVLVTHSGPPQELSVPGRPTVSLEAEGAELETGPEGTPDSGVSPAHLAYVVYTSGSTGQPKGVMISHASLVQRVLWGRSVPRLTSEDAMLQATAFSFDVSLWEIFASLLSGAGSRLVLAPAGRHVDTATLARLIAQEQVTTVGFVPSVLQLLLEEEAISRCTRLRYVFVGGEALSHPLRERFFQRLPHASLYNFYGPSETTIDATWFACEPGPAERPVPIGRPLGYTRAYVVDGHLRPTPIGVPGELLLGGPGLARGYLGAPELTAERFVPDPFSREPGARLYRTGDRVRWLADGQLEFLGRQDHQVKIRGVRVELGEVEAVLRQHPNIRDVAVFATSRNGGEAQARLLRALEEIERLSEGDVMARLADVHPSPTTSVEDLTSAASAVTANPERNDEQQRAKA